MYYLVTGNYEDECCGGQFEWIIKADSKEAAEKDARQDLAKTDCITSIEEISVEECIEREMTSITDEIIRQYKVLKYDCLNVPVREYVKLLRQLDNSSEEKYEAVKLAKKNLRMFRLLRKIVDTDIMTLKKVRNAVLRLSEADSEEQLNKIITEIKEENNESNS